MAVAAEMGKGSKPKKWVQKARARMERKGTVGSYRKITGTKRGKKIPVKRMEADVAKGGKIGKKALFALNMRRANS